MSRVWREIRRAPVRILTSVMALALAVGAIGVFAIPTVSTSSLRDAAERDGVPDVILATTSIDDPAVVERLDALPGVVAAEPQRLFVATVHGGADGSQGASDDPWSVDVLGLDLAEQTMDVVQLESGRLPAEPGEVLVTPGTTAVGSSFEVETVDGSVLPIEVVGIGRTSFWSDAGLAFADLGGLRELDPAASINRIVVRAEDDSASALAQVSDAARAQLADADVALTELPVEIADGKHPIEVEIEQISMLIGMLGIVAGLVGLVLLASTTNTLIVERSREIAVMRALGAPDRMVRRRLRRIALAIAAAAVVIGLPLGIAISYVIARMVLQEFVGLTPGFAISWTVLIASAAFALVGARLVAARSARRMTRQPLAEALRDRDAVPFGKRVSERLAVRWRTGRLANRLALRNGLRNRGRSIAISLQLGAAVAALMVVASLATTINDFNAAELEPVRWSSMTYVSGPGLDIAADAAASDPRAETAIEIEGELLDWQIDVYGWEPQTLMIDRTTTEGDWFSAPRDAVVSEGFAERVGISVGDRIDVELASGIVSYDVTGLHGNRGRDVYVARDVLAVDLTGGPSMVAPDALLANRLFSLDAFPATQVSGPTGVVLFDDLSEDDSGRTAILAIFGAIGIVVVSVAGLAVMSGLAVNLHERRHELAAMRALGARRRDLFSTLMTEVSMLAAAGVGVGLVGGYFGGRAIARSFEASNAVEIGFTFADRAIPAVLGAVVLLSLLITSLMVRRIARQSTAATLRSAA